MALASGTRLGPYEVLAPLGAGGMGEVYRARDMRLDRDVAIKVLPEAVASDPEASARFLREAKAVAALTHPNILAIHDFGMHGGGTYAVTELLEGETLRARLDSGAMTPKQAVDYALQISRGLSAAHERHIIHRDLKPENLFITRDGHVKILDFGLAKRVETAVPGEETSAPTESGHTVPGTVLGTLGYMSPEQVRGLPVDHRSDIFSFGAILHEMLSHKRAFQRSTGAETIAAILRDEPPNLAGSGQEISPALENIVRHCLEKNRDRRFQSARDIAFALEETPPSTLPSVRASPPTASKKRTTAAIAAGAAVALTLAAVVLIRRPSASSGGVPASIAVLPFTNLNSEKDQDYFSDGLSEELMGLLAKVRGLRVAGRMSSFAFKGKTDDLASIGQKLHVSSVLEGSVRRSGDQLRVTTQLVNVADGFQIWAEIYDRKASDVFAVQDEIAGAVVAALKVKLLPGEPKATSQSKTANMEAYNQFLLGRQFFSRQNQDGYRRAVAAFEKSVALDSRYTAAYAWLSRSLVQLVDFVDAVESDEIRRRAVWAADKAVELEPTQAEGYMARANSRTYIGFDWTGAQSDFRKALSLEPSDPTTHSQYARLLARLGKLREAIAESRTAAEMDLLASTHRNIQGCYLYSDGQFAEARKVLSRALEISPENEYGRFFLGVTELLDHNPRATLTVVGTPATAMRKTLLALAEHDLGHPTESQRALDELIAKHGATDGYHIASIYAWRGDKDKAFEWLERASDRHESQAARLKTDPLLAKLRDDPRYMAMLKKMNLPTGPTK